MGQQVPLMRARMRDAAADVMLEAAEHIMSSKGFTGATMQEIAAAAGCAVGTLYLHFKNKEELLRGIVLKHGQSLSDDIAAMASSDARPIEKLRFYVSSHLKWAHDHPTVANMLCNALPMRYYDFQATLRRILPEEHRQMKSIEFSFIEQAQAAGEIRSEIPATALVDLVDGFMFTVMDQFIARATTVPLQEQIDITWEFLMGGLNGAANTRKPAPSTKSPPKKKQT